MADTFIIPDEGKVRAMTYFRGTNAFAPADVYVNLLKATPTPADHTLVYADLVFADYSGAAEQQCTSWSSGSLSADFRGVITSDAKAFIPSSGSQTIYGISLHDINLGVRVIFAVRVFAVPFVISPGNPLVVSPEIFIGPPG
jgi:hypothetical protein